MVEKPMKRHNHVICRMCTKRGLLEEIVAVKRYQDKSEEGQRLKALYKYSLSLKNGDQAKFILKDKHTPDPQLEHNLDESPNN